jgi:hypothetical protein
MDRLVKEELQSALWITVKNLDRISRSTSSDLGSTEDVLMVTNSRIVDKPYSPELEPNIVLTCSFDRYLGSSVHLVILSSASVGR